MNHGLASTLEYASQFKSGLAALSPKTQTALKTGRVEALVFPPFLSLTSARDSFSGTPMQVGSQNVHFEEKGAFTGEISGPMLKEAGIEWTLIGHSERRQYFGETDQTAKKRANSHLKQGFKTVFCIGETRTEREAGKTNEVLSRQLNDGLPDEWVDKLVIAYEPVWAIGTGLTASPEQAQDAHHFTRSILEKRWGREISQKTLILYGGSVTPENFEGLLSKPDVDGGLVGGASLKADQYLKLVEIAGSIS